LEYIHKRTEVKDEEIFAHHVYSSSSHNNQKVKANLGSINGCTDQKNMVSPHNGILLSPKKEENEFYHMLQHG
jgi:hypothetical protein